MLCKDDDGREISRSGLEPDRICQFGMAIGVSGNMECPSGCGTVELKLRGVGFEADELLDTF